MTRSPFYLIQMSPWPLITSFSALSLMLSLIYWFHFKIFMLTMVSMMGILISSFLWWRDVIRESNQGMHSPMILKNIKMGMILFIISEIMFFFSFFWSYFHFSLSPDTSLNTLWPPVGIDKISPFSVPLLNTIILLSSGMTVTWSHHQIINKNLKISFFSLMITITLGFYFSMLQFMEYKEAQFNFSSSCFGSIFFIATGFHGLHVMIGTSLLMVMMARINQISQNHHVGFEISAWYWHFVDVVWIFLYLFIYWWPYFY